MNPLSFKKLNISATTLQMFSDFNLPFRDLAWHIPSPHLRGTGGPGLVARLKGHGTHLFKRMTQPKDTTQTG